MYSSESDSENFENHGPSIYSELKTGNKRQSSDSDATFCTTLDEPLPQAVEPIETQMERLEISQSQNSFTNKLNTVAQLSNQIRNITISNEEKFKDDDTVPNTSQGSETALTISSASKTELDSSKSVSNVIEILDSDEETTNKSVTVDTSFENVSPFTSPAKSSLNCVAIQKLNEFFDNIPDVQSPIKSIANIKSPHILAPLSENENAEKNTNHTESINVSETSSGQSSKHNLICSEKSFEKQDASQLSAKKSDEKLNNTVVSSKEESEESDSGKENDKNVVNAKMYPSKINISAKVAIRIQLSDSFTDSESSNAVSATSVDSNLLKPKCTLSARSQKSNKSSPNCSEASESKSSQQNCSESSKTMEKSVTINVVYDAPDQTLHESSPNCSETPISSTTPSPIIAPTPEQSSNKNSENSFTLNEENQALLDELYGNTWKTPATLKKCKGKKNDLNLPRKTDVAFHSDFTLRK